MTQARKQILHDPAKISDIIKGRIHNSDLAYAKRLLMWRMPVVPAIVPYSSYTDGNWDWFFWEDSNVNSIYL